MGNPRRYAVAAGVLFLITHITSVGALPLYQRAIDDPTGFVAGAGSTSPVVAGALMEVALAIAVVGTAAALYPLLRRVAPGAAMGYLGLRTLEAAVIAAGVMPMLALVDLRGSDVSGPLPQVLVDARAASFLIGPGFVIVANTMLLAWALRRTGLVPRWIPWLGLVGAPLILANSLLTAFGATEQLSGAAAVIVVPIFLWEISLAVRLIGWGFSEKV